MRRRPIGAIISGMPRLGGVSGCRAERSGLRPGVRVLALAVVVMVTACLAAGCGSAVRNAGNAVKSAISSLAPPHSSGAAPSSGGTITPTPTDTVTPTPTPTVTPTSTVTVTPTVTPSTQITTRLVTPHPTASPTPASGSAATKYVWLWVLLGVVVLAGLIAWIAAAAHRRRAAAAAAWRSRAVDAYARGSALYDAIGVAEAPGGLAAPDARARWYDIQRRADDLAQVLYGLRETARREDDRARAEDVIASLQAVRFAMDAERVPGGGGPQQAGIVRSRWYAFGESLRGLQASDRIR